MTGSSKMMLVTGISGHSGRLFAERLAGAKYTGAIRCAMRATSDAGFLARTGLNYSIAIGDITESVFLDEVMRGVDTVLHIANTRFSEKIIDAAIRNNVRWAILVHTTGRYSKFKSASEDYIRIEDGILALRDKIAVTILRPTMIYGSSRDQNMFKLVDYLYRHKFVPIFGNGKNLMQPVLAQDLADAYFDVLSHREITMNREYNLSGKEPISYIDLVRTVSRALGKNNVMVPVPMWLSLVGARAYNAVSSKALISVEQVLRMNEDKVFSHEAASRDFGYSPKSFDEGIRGEVDEYLQRKKLS
jgi:nucleoside-diphosphate-sugar epimerase